MSKHTVYLLLGTNLGDKFPNIEEAKKYINDEVGKLLNTSSVYETAAWGITDQPSFLNQVMAISVKISPEKVLDKILKIEKKMGRIREEKWGSRIIDIDILYFENKIINTENLKVPHPYLHERRFTLAPLAELIPDFNHPILKKTQSELLESCKDESNVNRLL